MAPPIAASQVVGEAEPAPPAVLCFSPRKTALAPASSGLVDPEHLFSAEGRARRQGTLRWVLPTSWWRRCSRHAAPLHSVRHLRPQ
jgi:hypothetical protein